MKTKILLILTLTFLVFGTIVTQPVDSSDDIENGSIPNENSTKAVLNSEDLSSKEDSTTEPNSIPLENSSVPDESSTNAVLTSEYLSSKETSTTEPNSIPLETEEDENVPMTSENDSGVNENNLNQNDQDSNSNEDESDLKPTSTATGPGTDFNETTVQSVAIQKSPSQQSVIGVMWRLFVRLILSIFAPILGYRFFFLSQYFN